MSDNPTRIPAVPTLLFGRSSAVDTVMLLSITRERALSLLDAMETMAAIAARRDDIQQLRVRLDNYTVATELGEEGEATLSGDVREAIEDLFCGDVPVSLLHGGALPELRTHPGFGGSIEIWGDRIAPIVTKQRGPGRGFEDVRRGYVFGERLATGLLAVLEPADLDAHGDWFVKNAPQELLAAGSEGLTYPGAKDPVRIPAGALSNALIARLLEHTLDDVRERALQLLRQLGPRRAR